MNVSVAIQAHPSRTEMAEALAARLDAEIVYDPDPAAGRSPWRTYRHALELTPADATHRLIVQEDTDPHPQFPQAAPAAVAAHPSRLIAFFVPGSLQQHCWSMLAACRRDEPWAVLPNDRWCQTVALCWPVALIQPIFDFVDRQNWDLRRFYADDEIVGRYLHDSGDRALATVPSLVEHPDLVPSILSSRRPMGGDDPSRVAFCPPPEDCDVASIDWAVGPS